MVIAFNKLKDPKMQLTDKIVFDEFKDCRLCNSLQDHYEYLIWAEKQGAIKLQQKTRDAIQAYLENV